MDPRHAVTLLLGLSIAACDGSIHVRGRVYTRAIHDTVPPSVAVVDRAGIDTTNLLPLAGATITLFQRVADTSATRTDTLLWVRRDTSRADGSYDIYDIGPPSPYTAALRVERAGYRTVTVTFRHRSVQEVHRAVVVLTPLSP
jgi:hypothetical protein